VRNGGGRRHLVGEEILTADTGISVSEDPGFRFFVHPRQDSKLTAGVTDSKRERRTPTLGFDQIGTQGS